MVLKKEPLEYTTNIFVYVFLIVTFYIDNKHTIKAYFSGNLHSLPRRPETFDSDILQKRTITHSVV